MDVGSIVQASKPDLMTRGVAIDQLQMAKRVGPQCKAAEYEDLSEEKGLTVGVKTGGSRVGGPELCV